MRLNSIGLTFEREIIRSFRSLENVFVHKVQTVINSKFAMAGIFDLLIIHNSKAIGIECKATNILSSFPFANIKPHQEQSLIEFKSAGGKAFVYIYIKADKNILIYLEIDEYLKLKQEMASKNRKSIPPSRLLELPFLKRKSRGIPWDLESII